MKKQTLVLSTICVALLASFGLNAAAPKASTNQAAQDRNELPADDADLVKDVREALTNDKTLSKHGQSIRVTAKNGNVVLQGYVTSEKEKSSVNNTVKQVAGVKKIDNQLKIVVK